MVFRPVRPAEVAAAMRQNAAAFGGSPPDAAREDEFARAVAAGTLWGIDGAGRLLGNCWLREVDHFFGGRAVRCMEVAGVAVAPEHRRAGVATAMMEGAVGWGAHRGLGLSLLFPAVPLLYRRVGWEFSGTFPRSPLPAAVSPPAAEPMRPAAPADLDAVAACHERYAATLAGPGRRNGRRWGWLLRGEALYVLDGGDGIEAYVLLYRGADPSDDAQAPVSVDWGATTPRGMRAVARLLTERCSDAIVRGPLPDAASLAASTWEVPATTGLYWMARTLVLGAAVSQRGFPAGVDATTTLAIDDPLLPGLRGPWRLEVHGGAGTLTPATAAAVVMDPRATGPLYTGFRSASQLARAGLLDGPREAVDVLDAMFAGPPPVVLDFF